MQNECCMLDIQCQSASEQEVERRLREEIAHQAADQQRLAWESRDKSRRAGRCLQQHCDKGGGDRSLGSMQPGLKFRQRQTGLRQGRGEDLQRPRTGSEDLAMSRKTCTRIQGTFRKVKRRQHSHFEMASSGSSPA